MKHTNQIVSKFVAQEIAQDGIAHLTCQASIQADLEKLRVEVAPAGIVFKADDGEGPGGAMNSEASAANRDATFFGEDFPGQAFSMAQESGNRIVIETQN